MKDITLVGVRAVNALPFADVSSVKRLRILKAKSVDLTFLKSTFALEDIGLADCDTVTGIETLILLPSLKSVLLIDVPSIQSADRLTELDPSVGLDLGGVVDAAVPRDTVKAQADQRPAMFWHACIATPLKVPGEVSYDSGAGELVPLWWDMASETKLRPYLLRFLDRLLAELEPRGLDAIEMEHKRVPIADLSRHEVADHRGEVVFVDAAGDELAKSGDTILDGVFVYEST